MICELGLKLGKSISELMSLSHSELKLWQAYLLREKGIPIGEPEKLEQKIKEVEQNEKLNEQNRLIEESKRVLSTVTWS